MKRVVAASMVGSVAEWYEFFLYGTASALVFGTHFFKKTGNPIDGLLAAFAAGVAGGTAPDWLEVAWWTRKRRLWITHRTVTHWGIGWIALLALGW
ncbi:hypothetical protein SB778_37995, partial [Paraburkholderia sp. SIMBA_050]